MLPKQGVYIECAAYVVCGIDRADFDIGAAIGRINLLQIRCSHCIDQRSWRWIASYTAAEIVDMAGQLFFVALAQKVDLGDHQSRLSFIESLSPDIGQQPRLSDTDFDLTAHLASHFDRCIGMIQQSVQNSAIHNNFGTGTRNFDDFANFMAFGTL